MNYAPLTISHKQIVGVRGTDRRCVVTQIISASKVGVRDLEGGKPPEEIGVEWLTPPPPPAGSPCLAGSTAAAETWQPTELSAISDEDWRKAKERREAIKPLLSIHRPPVHLVKEYARRFGVHHSTFRRWIDLHKNSGGLLISLVDHSCSVPLGTQKLPAAIEAVIKECIEKHYLTPQRKRVKAVHEALRIACDEKDGEIKEAYAKEVAALQPDPVTGKDSAKQVEPLRLDPVTGKVCCPHINTVRARILTFSGLRRTRAREGPSEASKFTSTGEGFVARWPLEYVQVDHTLLNVTLIDGATNRILGRPWLTLAIDVFSRAVVGYYVSFDPPGALGTGLCVSQAILPKEDWLRAHARYFETVPEWPCYGKPVHLHTDNAREFRGEMLKKACENHGINAIFRPVRQPHFGAHIESMMGTISDELSNLAGATFSNPVERGKHYDSEKRAEVSPELFDAWLANLLLVKYHHRQHSSLGRTPLERWHQAFTEDTDLAPALGALPDRFTGEAAENLQLDFLPLAERAISEQGVVIELIRYWGSALRQWVLAKDPKHPNATRYFQFHYDPRDMSYIYFWEPKLKHYEKIPYRDMSRAPVTLWEWRAARRFLTDKGSPMRQQSEAMVFEAVKTMRRIEEAAAARKGKQKAAGKFRGGVHGQRLKKPTKPDPSNQSDEAAAPPELAGTTKVYQDLEVLVGTGS